MPSYKFIITGIVQGVYYRKNVSENSNKANFSGYVKNLPDGSVEAAVTCKEEEVTKFIQLLEEGSPQSVVTHIEKIPHDETFINGFEIRY